VSLSAPRSSGPGGGGLRDQELTGAGEVSARGSGPAIWWARRDLRLGDNPALAAAIRAGGGEVLALFVLDPLPLRDAGPARRAYLARCLAALDQETGGRLVLRRGDPREVVPDLAAEVGATTVVATADYGPYGRRRDRAVRDRLAVGGRRLAYVGTPYAVPPGRLRTRDGRPFSVFTPYYRAWLTQEIPPPSPPPATVAWCQAPSRPTVGELLAELDCATTDLPAAGERAAMARFEEFLAEAAGVYDRRRDQPGEPSTSRLSAALRFGCLHPRQLLARLEDRRATPERVGGGGGRGLEAFRRQLVWREFYADVLYAHPESTQRPLVAAFDRLVVDRDARAADRLVAWQTGRTGYPIVDAGMRQLAREAWMHNRVRMIVASFLVKDLHLDWRVGEAFFRRHLADFDLANNVLGWQWVAGCGTDAAPFYRVFNPVLQGRRFDPEGTYVRRYVPELASLDAEAIHEPWRVGGVAGYPAPIVDHLAERDEALRRWQALRSGSEGGGPAGDPVDGATVGTMGGGPGTGTARGARATRRPTDGAGRTREG